MALPHFIAGMGVTSLEQCCHLLGVSLEPLSRVSPHPRTINCSDGYIEYFGDDSLWQARFTIDEAHVPELLAIPGVQEVLLIT